MSCRKVTTGVLGWAKVVASYFWSGDVCVLCLNNQFKAECLWQVDGKTNPKIHSVFLDSFPIYTAKFSADGNQVIMGSRHKSFYYYDLIADKVLRVPKLGEKRPFLVASVHVTSKHNCRVEFRKLVNRSLFFRQANGQRRNKAL